MKKIIVLIGMILLFIPLVSAVCTWYNPFTWGECIADFFKEERVATDICENEIITWTTNEAIHKTETKICEPLNLSCTDKDIDVFSHIEIVQHNKTVCKPTGDINLNGINISIKNFFGKVFNNEVIIFYSEIDSAGSNEISETTDINILGECKSGKTYYAIDIETGKKVFCNSLKTTLEQK